MSKLSVLYIAKDAEETIGQSIASVAPVADQVVVVIDDRTTDDTESAIDEVLREKYFGNDHVVVLRPWNHSFADARNAALDLCDGPWIMTMDADEELDPESIDLIKTALADTPNGGGADLYTCPLLVDPTYGSPNYTHDDFGPCSVVHRDRIFWKPSGARFRFRVHEHLLFPGSGQNEYLNARFFHRGTMSPDKSDYYTALLMLDHIDNPEEPVPATMLAEAAIGAGDTHRAAAYLDTVDKDFVQGLNGSKYYQAKGKIAQKAWIQAATTMKPGITKKALDELRDEALACYQRAHRQNTGDADPVILAATILFVGWEDRYTEALAMLESLIDRDPNCIVATGILDLWKTFGEDREAFLRRLGDYLTNRANIEADAALHAEGRSSDPQIANVERLDDILNSGGRQAKPARPRSKAERRERYKQRAENGRALKVGQ